jgi:branched-chain amino acid transport system ATP-binding protein
LLDVALAVASGARVLLLDEPTAGMSQSEAQRFVEQLQRVLQGQTLVFVEHDMAVAFALATRVAVLSQGRLVAVDTPEAIRQNPQVQADYLRVPHV